MFAKAARGVSFLHHHGIVHRDLKPENILMDRGSSPLVADLGIAHVNPDFVSVGLRTVEAEKLLNRDYYAPEQRFGSSTGVDHRADVYALGLILYELLTAIPPVRVSTPPLEATSAALSPLDPIWRRMTNWDPEKRFQSIDDALDDAWIALGLVIATMRGAAGLRNPDLETMTKLLRSNNDMQRRQGIEIATRLNKAALGHLHALLGHGRRDVRNSVATALGHIGEAESLPYLVAALYGNTEKPSQFRPGSEAATAAIALYPSAEKLRAIKMVSKPVRPTQVLTVLRDVDKDEAVDAVRLLMKEGHLLLDWSETLIGVLVELDEDAVWPDVLELVRSRRDFQIREAIPKLTPQRRAEALRQWVVQGVDYSWHFREQIRIAQTLDTLTQDKRDILTLIEQKIRAYNKKFDERESFLSRIARIIEELPPEVAI